MKRHVAWLLSCGLLVGCASTPPPIDEPSAHPHTTTPTAQPGSAAAADSTSAGGASTSSTTRAAFHFKSGTLEIGDFDPYALGDNLFDPCTEISPEEFAAAGFENVEPIPEEYAGLARGIKACSFTAHPQVESELLGNNNAPRSILSERVKILTQYKSEVLPDIFVYKPPGDMDLDCYAQVDTREGAIVVSAGIIERRSSSPDICAVAMTNLEKLIRESIQ